MPKLATICYLDNGQELLLLHRNKKVNDIHQGKWIGVGGKLEAGESPEDCVIREVKEETGLTLHQPQLVGLITFPEFTPEDDWYTYVFRARHFSGHLGDCDEGTLAWVPYDTVLSQPTWEGDRIFLDWILADKPFFSAKFCYDHQQALTDYEVTFYPTIQ